MELFNISQVLLILVSLVMRCNTSTQQQISSQKKNVEFFPLASCEAVEFLDLSHKEITSLRREDFARCSDLKVLYLHDNHLNSLPDDVFHYLTLDIISLHDNPWQCDCSLVWLSKWLETVNLEKDVFCTYPNDFKQIRIQLIADECLGSSSHIRNRRSVSTINVDYLPKEPYNCDSLKFEVNTNMTLEVRSSDPMLDIDLLIDNNIVKTIGPLEVLWFTFENIGIFELTVNVSFASRFETWVKLVNVTQITNHNYEIKAVPSSDHNNICTQVNVMLYVEETPRECIALDTNYTWYINDQAFYGENITHAFDDATSNTSQIQVTVSDEQIRKTVILISNKVILTDQYHPLNTAVTIKPQSFTVCNKYFYSWMVNGSLEASSVANSTTVPQFQHTFYDEGAYEVVLNVSTLSLYSAIVYVEKVISFELIRNSNTYADVLYILSPVSFHSSRNCQYRWTINNQDASWEIWNGIEPPEFHHVFQNESIHNLQLEVKNNVSYFAKNLSVIVQNPLTEVKGSFNESNVKRGQTIQLQVSFKYASIFPYHINVFDERETINETFTTTVNTIIYSLPIISTSIVGQNIITFVLSDNSNSTSIDFTIYVIDPIVSIEVVLSKYTINVGESVNASVLQVPDSIKPVSFTWFEQYLQDNPVLIGIGTHLPPYIFNKSGKYVIILLADNKISNYTLRINLTVIHFINIQLTATLPSGLTVSAPSDVAVVPNSNIDFVGEITSSNSFSLKWFVNNILQFGINSNFSYPVLLQGTYKITLNASTQYGWNASTLQVFVQKQISVVSLQGFIANSSLVNNMIKDLNFTNVYYEPIDAFGVFGNFHCNNTDRNIKFYQTNFSQNQVDVFVIPIQSLSGEITCRVYLWNHVSSVSEYYSYLIGPVPMLAFVNPVSILRFNETYMFVANVTNTVISSSLKWFLDSEEIRSCSIIMQPNYSATTFCTITFETNSLATVNLLVTNQYIVSNRSVTIRLYENLFGISPVHIPVGIPTVIIAYAHITVDRYFWNDFDVFGNTVTMISTEPQKKAIMVTVYTQTNSWTHTFYVISYDSGNFQINSTVPILENGTTQIMNVEKDATSLFFISNADPYSHYNWNFIVDTGHSRVTEYYPKKQSINYHVSSEKILIKVIEKNPLSEITKVLTIFSYLPIQSLSINFTHWIIFTNMTSSVTIQWDGNGLQHVSSVNVTNAKSFRYHMSPTEQQLSLEFLTSSESKNMSINIRVCGLVNCMKKSWICKVYAKIRNISLAGFLPDISVNKSLTFHVYEQLHESTSVAWKLLDHNGTFIKHLGFGPSVLFSGVHEPGFFYIDVVAQGILIEGNFLRRAFLLNVFQADCSEPLVLFNRPTYQNHLKSNWFYGKLNISTDCNNITQQWTFIKAFREVQNCNHQSSDAPSFSPNHPSQIEVLLNKSTIQLPPLAFDIGSYCIKHVISYGGTGKKFSFFYFSVQSTPLIPIISGGAYRVIGNKQEVQLSGSLTINPDEMHSSTVLLYRWIISSACFVSQFPNVSVHQWSPFNIHIQVKRNCLSDATTFNVKMQVKRSEEDIYQEVEQQVDVIEGFAPLLEIECFTCKAYKSLKYLRNKKLKLLARCSNCGDVEATYKWQVIGNKDKKRIPLTTENVLSPLSTATLVLEKFVLNGVQAYTIICKVIIKGMDSLGTSSIILEENGSPENGTCKFQSLHPVRSMVDQFQVHCSGWEDSDNQNQPFLYWLLAGTSEDLSSMSVLYRGTQNTMEVYLPLGSKANNWTLFVEIRVEDSLGAYTVANYSHITVVLPEEVSEGNVTTFLMTSAVPLINENKERRNLNKLITLTMVSLSFLNLAKNESNHSSILNTLVESMAKLEATSFSSTERIVDTLDKVYNQANVITDLNAESHFSTLSSLRKLLNVARLFAKKGIDFEDNTLKGYTNLINNNIKFDILNENTRGTRKRRSTDNSSATLSYDTLQLFYRVVLESVIPGENDKTLLNEPISAVLSRDHGKRIGDQKGIGYCGVSFDISSVVQMADVLSILECSTVDIYREPRSLNITSFTLINDQSHDVLISNLPINEQVILSVPQTPLNSYHENSSLTISPNELHASTLQNYSLVDDLEHTGFHIVIDVVDVEDSADGSIYVYFSENVPLSYDSTVAKVINKYSDEESRTVFLSGSNYKSDSLYYYGIQNDFTTPVNVTITIYTSQCTFWNVSTNQWENSGCMPTGGTTRQRVSCKCTHLTSFTGSLELSPNPLDFSVLKKLDVSDNPIVVITCSVVLFLYLVAIFFAYRRDKKEQSDDHVIPYIGSSDGFYQYEIRIKTGMYPWAGTTARVGIQIFGTSCTTKVRVFKTEESFMRNAVDIFRISLDRSIGKIYKVQVWHDNSGSEPSWYLERLVIRNLSNGGKFFFFCNRWIGIDCEDGTLEHEFHAADIHEMKKFSTIFFDVLARGLSDYHLWLSLFERPKFSRFTCMQRITCLVTFILSWMCVSAMWFQVAPAGKVDLYIGFKGYSIEELLIGMISVAMVFPLNFLLVFLFRKSKQRKAPEKQVKIWKPNRHMKQDLVDIDMIQLIADESMEEFDLGFTSSPIRRKKKCFNIHDLLDEDTSDVMMNKDFPTIDKLVLRTSVLADSTLSSSPPLTLPHSFATNSNDQANVMFKHPKKLQETGDNLVHLTMEKTFEPKEDFLDEEMIEMNPPFHLPLLDPNELRSHMTEIVEQQLSSMVHNMHEKSLKHDVGILSDNSSGIFRHDSVTASLIQKNEMLAEQLQIPDIIELDPVTRWYLPHWCVYVAYTLCFLISGLSIVIVITYGQQFGYDVSLKWLKSLFLGCLEDFFCAYPFMLLLVAFVLAIFVKPLDLDKVDHDDFVECASGKSVQYETNTEAILPPSGYALELLKREGVKMKRFRKFVKDAIFQALLMWFVLGICFSKYSTRWYETTEMFEKDLNHPIDIMNVTKINDYWSWLNASFLPFTYSNNENTNRWKMSSDPVIRQVRSSVSDCVAEKYADIMNIQSCLTSSYVNVNAFNNNWSFPLEDKFEETAVTSPWMYRHHKSLKTFGIIRDYPASGYEWRLSLNDGLQRSQLNLKKLQNQQWVDRYTRALVHEMIGLDTTTLQYVSITFLVEISFSGYMHTTFNLKYFPAKYFLTNLDYFSMFCLIMLSILTIYIFVSLIRKVHIKNWECLNKFWTIHLALVMLTSMAAVILQVGHLFALSDFRDDLQNGYIPYGISSKSISFLDDVIMYVFGFLAFLVIVRTVRLFRGFNSYKNMTELFQNSLKVVLQLMCFHLTVTLCFSALMLLTFQPRVFEYRNFWHSFLSILFYRWSKQSVKETVSSSRGLGMFWNILWMLYWLFIALIFKVELINGYVPKATSGQENSFWKYVYSHLLKPKKKERHVHFVDDDDDDDSGEQDSVEDDHLPTSDSNQPVREEIASFQNDDDLPPLPFKLQESDPNLSAILNGLDEMVAHEHWMEQTLLKIQQKLI